MAMTTIGVAECRRVRWRRSAWHRLLVAIDARAAGTALPVPLLLGVRPERMEGWLSADELMPLKIQWQLVQIGEACFRDDPQLVRAAHALRRQLEAMAAYVERGPVHTSLTPEAVKAG